MATSYCYILHSQKLNRFYTGVTHVDLSDRTLKHNTAAYGNHRYTAKADDWELFFVIPCITYSQAVRIERHIKRMKSSAYIRKLAEHPGMVEKLLLKYSS